MYINDCVADTQFLFRRQGAMKLLVCAATLLALLSACSSEPESSGPAEDIPANTNSDAGQPAAALDVESDVESDASGMVDDATESPPPGTRLTPNGGTIWLGDVGVSLKAGGIEAEIVVQASQIHDFPALPVWAEAVAGYSITLSDPDQLVGTAEVIFGAEFVDDDSTPVVLHYNERHQRYEILTSARDPMTQNIHGLTANFSVFVLARLAGSALVASTVGEYSVPDYNPATDSFARRNSGDWMNGFSPKGLCFGFAAYADWYFREFGSGLRAAYSAEMEEVVPIRAFFSSEESSWIYVPGKAWDALLFYTGFESASLAHLKTSLYASGLPRVVVLLRESGDGHAVLAYGWDDQGVLLYDSNYPDGCAGPCRLSLQSGKVVASGAEYDGFLHGPGSSFFSSAAFQAIHEQASDDGYNGMQWIAPSGLQTSPTLDLNVDKQGFHQGWPAGRLYVRAPDGVVQAVDVPVDFVPLQVPDVSLQPGDNRLTFLVGGCYPEAGDLCLFDPPFRGTALGRRTVTFQPPVASGCAGEPCESAEDCPKTDFCLTWTCEAGACVGTSKCPSGSHCIGPADSWTSESGPQPKCEECGEQGQPSCCGPCDVRCEGTCVQERLWDGPKLCATGKHVSRLGDSWPAPPQSEDGYVATCTAEEAACCLGNTCGNGQPEECSGESLYGPMSSKPFVEGCCDISPSVASGEEQGWKYTCGSQCAILPVSQEGQQACCGFKYHETGGSKTVGCHGGPLCCGTVDYSGGCYSEETAVCCSNGSEYWVCEHPKTCGSAPGSEQCLGG